MFLIPYVSVILINNAYIVMHSQCITNNTIHASNFSLVT